MNNKLFSLVAALVASVVMTQPLAAEDSPSKEARPAKAEGSGRGGNKSLYPFRGTVASVDTAAHTIALARQEGGDRVLKVGTDSAFVRDGKDIPSGEVRKGDYLHGRVERHPNGEEVIVKATAGTKPEKGEGEEKPKRSRKKAAAQ